MTLLSPFMLLFSPPQIAESRPVAENEFTGDGEIEFPYPNIKFPSIIFALSQLSSGV